MKRTAYLVFGALIVIVIGMSMLFRAAPDLPRISETQVHDAIQAAVRAEADTAFLITGYVDLSAAARSINTRVLLPNLLDISLGTTTATVRLPGRVAYGFDVEGLTPEMIRAYGDTIEVELPIVRIFSVEPDLSRLEVETRTGWARAATTAQQAERRAVQLLGEALRQQGEAYLQGSAQPNVNTARAIRRIAGPVVVALGIAEPHFRIYLGEGLLLEDEVNVPERRPVATDAGA